MKQNSLFQMSFFSNPLPQSARPQPVKVFLNYLHLVMLIDFFHLTWPDLMLNLFNAQEAVRLP